MPDLRNPARLAAPDIPENPYAPIRGEVTARTVPSRLPPSLLDESTDWRARREVAPGSYMNFYLPSALFPVRRDRCGAGKRRQSGGGNSFSGGGCASAGAR
jgi:hypothetical protein